MSDENDQPTLNVLPNPWAATDDKGRPIAAFPHEGRIDSYVGAEVDHVRTKKLDRRCFMPLGFERKKETSADDIAKAWDGVKPVKVLDTPYYRNALARGDLLPADEAAAKAAGLKLHPTAHAHGTTPEKALAKEGEKPAAAPSRVHAHGTAAIEAAKKLAAERHAAYHAPPPVKAEPPPPPPPADDQASQSKEPKR